MVDKVKPLKLENSSLGGTENDPFPSETDPTEDYLSAKGLALENSDSTVIYGDSGVLKFKDSQKTTAHSLDNILDAEYEDFDPTGTDLTSVKTGPAIRELFDLASMSASPGYSFGRSGDVTAGTWLLRTGSVPSNKTGVNISVGSPILNIISTGSENADTYTLEIYQHEGNEVGLVLNTTVTVTASRKEVLFLTTDFTMTNALVQDKHIAVKLATGSARNIGVDLQLSGSNS